MPHLVTPHTPGQADHAADRRPVDAATVARYASALLPAVLWLLGVHVFDGEVPAALQGLVSLAVTALCTAVVGYTHRRVR